jgi:hypothetical protein
MQLSELYLNRQLYKEGQTSETDNSEYVSANQTNYPSGYISYGGNAAIDVNTNTPNINGDKIRTGAIESTRYTYVSGVFSTNGMQINLNNGEIRSPQFGIDALGNAYFKGDISGSSGTFSGNITVGTGNSVFKAFAGTGIWVGNAVFGSAPFRVDMAGNVTASSVTLTNASVGTGSTWTGNQIANAYIGNLNANKITTGTLTVGDGVSQATILINQSTSGGGGADAFLRWSGGSRIWSDGSNDMGLNAIGGDIIFYGNSTQMVQFTSGGQAIFGVNSPYAPTGIVCVGNFNVGVTGSANIPISRFNGGYVYFSNSGGNSSIYGGNSNRMEYNASNYHYFNIGGNLRFQVSNTGIYVPLGFFNLCQMTGATAAGISAQDGSMYYRTDYNTVRVRVAGTWRTLSWT